MKVRSNDARSRGDWQGMNWIRQEKRLAIYLRDGLACAWCSASIEDGTTLSLDHLTPHSKGGSNRESNLVTACSRCNSSRGNRSVRKFAEVVAAYLSALYPEAVANSIESHVRDCSGRPLDLAAAKQLIARRGSVARALAGEGK